MIFMGLDTGTTSGCGVLDGDRFVYAEAHHCDGTNDAEVFTDFRKWLFAQLIRFNPDVIGIEEPLRTDISVDGVEIIKGVEVKVKKPIGTMRTFLRLYGLRGHAVQICGSGRIAKHREGLGLSPLDYREINNKSWRSIVYPKESPPAGTSDTSAWWKQRALSQCHMLKWPVTQKDAAEATMIAEALRVQIKMEKLAAQPKPPPVDLFNPTPIPNPPIDEKERPF